MHHAPDAAIDAVIACLLADGSEAARRAQALADDPAATPERRAMAWTLIALRDLREGSADAAEAALAHARALAGAEPPPRLQALLLHADATRARSAGRLAEAQALLAALHARAGARPAADAYLSAASLGIVESMLGHDDAALDAMYHALHLARRSGMDSLLVNALSNLGSFESDLYNLEDALPLLEEAVAGAERSGSRRQLIFAAGNLVQCLVLRGDAPQALAVALDRLAPALRADDPPALRRDDEIAAALLLNGRVDEAAVLLANELYGGALTNELATLRVNLLARIRLARGDAAGALQLCEQRRAVLAAGGEEVTPAADRVELLRVAARAADTLGRHAEAYALLHEAFALHEDLLGRAARSRRLSLQITHRLRQAEWERDSAHQMASALEDLNASLRAEAAENERLKARLLALALEDPLTGLPNRRHLFDAGARLLAAQRRRGGPLAGALIDLDHFKQVNDTHGHNAGDAVLRAFAALLQREIRAGDIACRHGGEEFVLLMADASAEQAAQRLRTLLEAFGALRFDGQGGPFHCSFSAGVADWQPPDETLDGLLRRADGALYAAKGAGRAAVRLAAR